ncbi:hypothetical protein IAR55_005690 [Kwoniella newhampshirensis]|uniref:RRM domain-containing protein n=1 Tax=Kwoniella newhampshirensis TaxID=1651941 RepID=A0AAW0YUZ7_9TREE
MSEEDFIALDQGSSSKKERKERVNTTLFISSLPYTATSTDLLTHFSYLGPVRHGFVATDKETGKSKGVGYVTYSLREDAEKALAELNGGGFGGGNRKIRVSWADERLSLKERKVERAEAQLNPKPKPTPRAAPGEEKSSDPNAIRTLVLSGLPEAITKNVLWKKVRKVNENAELVYPVTSEDGEAVPEDSANIIFPSHGDALKALPKLHGHTYKGALLSCVLKKRLEKLSAKGQGKNPSHAGRLIVRNLSWDTTVQDLRASFLPFGPIHSIDLPTLPSKLPPSADPSKPPPPPRARGFAFVWFLTKNDAEKAIEGVNGKVLKTAKGGKADTEGRVVAVDWALSKEKWEETKKVEGGEDEKKEDASGSDSGSGSDEESASESDDGSGSEDDEGDETDGADEDEDMEDAEEEEPVKPKLPAVGVGSTLFIRNLPFETTEQELNALFRSFGPLRYARITMDKFTGRSRGTGFVCFWNVEHANEAIEEAERVTRETGANAMPLGGGAAQAKNPFALPSVLTADPSSSLASRLVIHGRTLDVTRAVTREEAGQMKEDSERSRQAGDKRNTYLMREGVIFPNSPAAASLPESEVEKRQQSFNARKTLLRSNPSLYISKTRLSIRQLPLFATDRTLKRLAIHAVRAFDDEVKSGDREGLARSEEMDDTLSAAIAARKDSKKGKGKERETVVIQSKIVRQTEKVDALTGQGRSKGYGFLEMRSHKDALKVLRWANNNPVVGTLMWDWWKVELGDIKERTEKALIAARKKAEGPVAGAGESDDKAKKAVQKKDDKDEKKGGESVEELEGRLKKIEGRLEEGDDRSGGGMRGGKTLMIEFSIENIQVVKRRVEKIVSHRDGGSTPRQGDKRKASDRIEAEDTDDEGAAPEPKKRKWDEKKGKGKAVGGSGGGDKRSGDRPRLAPQSKVYKTDKKANPTPAPVPEVKEKRGIEKMGNQLGSMIGRKRKMRKGGK